MNLLLVAPFIIAAIVGIALYIRFLSRSGKLRAVTSKLETPKDEREMDVPKEWISERGGLPAPAKKGETVTVEVKKSRRKIRIAFLRRVNFLIGVVVFLYNVFMSQGVLMANPAAYPLFLPFILSAYCALRMLWDRRKPQEPAEWKANK